MERADWLQTSSTFRRQTADSFQSFMAAALPALASLGDIEERMLGKGWGMRAMSANEIEQHLRVSSFTG